MTQAQPAIFKIPTKSPQLPRGKATRARKAAAAMPKMASRVAAVETRAATRGDGEVIELEHGITVYPPREQGGRWRAVWHEDGERQQCESVSEAKLTGKLEKVRQRLATGAANMTKPGADLIAWYLNPDRLPVADRWSRKHAYTQRSLCQRFAAPVIGAVEAPKNRKFRRTIYPRRTPGGYPLAERLAARIEEARAEQAAGTNPLGLIFPVSAGRYWRSSNFNRRVLQPAYQKAGWRDAAGSGQWTWHSLRHVFCTTALFTWKLDATDVSRMAGHANYRITLDMYVGTTADVLDRARSATE